MNAKDARIHQNDIINELSHKNFHIESLKREIELLTPMFESSIVTPKTKDIRNLTKEDLNVDVIPATLATMETIQARKAFYYAKEELAGMLIARDSLINLYNTYNAHVKQDLEKQAKPLTDNMIFDAYKEAQKIKTLSKEESDALKSIGANLLQSVHSDGQSRLEVYEALWNLNQQHKK
jgi:hypothetical protein